MIKPNWRNADDYKFAEELPFAGWAWEFLRRNPVYLSDWEKAKISLGKLGEKYPCLSQEEWMSLFRDEQLHFSIIVIARKWGLEPILPNPDEPFHPVSQNWIQAGRSIIGPSPDWDLWGDPRYMVLAFDLTRPIYDQIKMAESEFNSKRDARVKDGVIELIPVKRDLSGLWIHYLRVLDAEIGGATISQMAAVLVPNKENEYPEYAGNKTINNWLTAARKLRDVEYIGLPVISSDLNGKRP